MFASGICSLIDSPDEHLEVVVPESDYRCAVHVLDVVTVVICCDSWDARARVPHPRLHWIANLSTRTPTSRGQGKLKRPEIQSSASVEHRHSEKGGGTGGDSSRLISLYSETLKLHTPSVLCDTPLRAREKRADPHNGNPTMTGRMIFGGFRNPDTHSAKQQASIAEATEAALQRRNQVMANQARNKEFDTTHRIEKDTTARMQRLAAGKRNTRKSKGK
jgi:hypothetical protein